jgi:hypothetical protein
MFKDPITDDGIKRSAVGRLQVIRDADGTLRLDDGYTKDIDADVALSELRPVWRDGGFVYAESLQTIRERLRRLGRDK